MLATRIPNEREVIDMHIIDPEDPIYKNLTKRELQNLRLFTREEKEAISMQLFGETLYVRPDWKQLSVARW